jgi:6-phosphogluconolactonase/glucosamine-6-phosphate isomerase/deaminase
MAAAVWFIVTGDSKRHALQAWLAGAQLPPQTIRPRVGIDIFTDIES